MDKKSFLTSLRAGLKGLPQEDINERVNFYSEMIDDYVEEGLSEEEAVSRIGSSKEIAAQIIADSPLSKPPAVAKKSCSKRNPWKMAMIILGSPIWLALLISLFAVVLSVYISLWAVVIALWAAFAAIGCCALAGILCGVGFMIGGHGQSGLFLVGAGLVLAGLSILACYCCKAVTKGMVWLTKKCALAFKNRLKKKEAAQ